MVKSNVDTGQYDNGIVKCEKKKGTTECDKRIVICDIDTAQCDDETVKCEEKKLEYQRM